MVLKMLPCFIIAMSLTMSVGAQAPGAGASAGHQVVTGEIPRLADGHPNFEGMWFTAPFRKVDAFTSGGANGYGSFENLLAAGGGGRGGATAPGAAAGRGGGGAPQRTRPKYFPEAAAIQEHLQKYHLFADPEGLCQIPGLPRAFVTPPYPYQFIQDEKSLTMLLEYVHDFRVIPTDNSKHPQKYWAWNGDSRGHWEGDTLVVDVANFNGRAWLDTQGTFFDDKLHTVERYTFTGPDTIAYEATVTDPGILAEPWINRRTFYRQPDTEQIMEYGCKEGEHSIEHYTEDLGGKAKVKGGKTE